MAKENSIKIKREPTVWENVFANDTSGKGLILSEIKNSHNSILRRQTTQLKNGQGLEQTLLQGGHTEGPETYEKMLSIASYQRDAN